MAFFKSIASLFKDKCSSEKSTSKNIKVSLTYDSNIQAEKIVSNGENNKSAKYYSPSEYSTARFLEWCSYSAHKIEKSSDNYPKWMFYECGIVDPIKKHKQLVDKGYLLLADTKTQLAKLKVDELKEILKGYDVPAKGK